MHAAQIACRHGTQTTLALRVRSLVTISLPRVPRPEADREATQPANQIAHHQCRVRSCDDLRGAACSATHAPALGLWLFARNAEESASSFQASRDFMYQF